MTRWPVIRHVRWAWLTVRFNLWWNSFGRHFWLVPNESDVAFLDAVWRGEE